MDRRDAERSPSIGDASAKRGWVGFIVLLLIAGLSYVAMMATNHSATTSSIPGLFGLLAYLMFALSQSLGWQLIRSKATRAETGRGHVVHYLETVREYVANEPAASYEFAEPAGSTGERR